MAGLAADDRPERHDRVDLALREERRGGERDFDRSGHVRRHDRVRGDAGFGESPLAPPTAASR